MILLLQSVVDFAAGGRLASFTLVILMLLVLTRRVPRHQGVAKALGEHRHYEFRHVQIFFIPQR